MTKALTVAELDALRKVRGQQVERFDTLAGLSARASQAGRVSYVFTYRVAGKKKKLTLGHYPETSLKAAREKAAEYRREVDRGKDPAVSSKQLKAEYHDLVFEKLVDKFVTTYAKPKNRGWEDVAQTLRREFVTRWSQWPITSITRKEVHKILDAIAARSATPAAAKNAFAVVRKFFNWCRERDYVPTSPCEGIIVQSYAARERVLTDRELVSIWKAAEELGWPYGKMVQILLLTGQRRREVAGLQWAELELDNGHWTLPAQRNKGKRIHELPLSAAVVAIFQQLPRHAVYVFPAAKTRERDRPLRSMSGFSDYKDRLDALSGVKDWRLHDLRRTFASTMPRLRPAVPQDITNRVLNHKLAGVEGVYNRFEYLDEKRDALTKYADFVAMLLWADRLPLQVSSVEAR